MSGGSNRTTHSGVLRLDDSASPSEIPVIRIQDRVSVGSRVWCVSGSLLGSTDPLTEHPPSKTDNPFSIYKCNKVSLRNLRHTPLKTEGFFVALP